MRLFGGSHAVGSPLVALRRSPDRNAEQYEEADGAEHTVEGRIHRKAAPARLRHTHVLHTPAWRTREPLECTECRSTELDDAHDPRLDGVYNQFIRESGTIG